MVKSSLADVAEIMAVSPATQGAGAPGPSDARPGRSERMDAWRWLMSQCEQVREALQDALDAGEQPDAELQARR